MACCLLACLVLQSILLLTWASLNTICSVAQEQRFNGRLRVVVPPFYASNKQTNAQLKCSRSTIHILLTLNRRLYSLSGSTLPGF